MSLRLPAPNDHSLIKKINNYVKAHLIQTVWLSLILLWFVISWLVYKAESGAPNANITSYGKAVWWGVVTFLTVGYGDYYPITTQGRFFASILMFAGVFSIAIVTSKISSYFLEQILKEDRGLVNTSTLNNHFIICGWKEEMHDLLLHILEFNSDLTASDLVLIANIGATEIENLRSHEKLKNLRVLVGNYFETTNLERAAPDRARKILILADRTPGHNGTVPSMTEVDSRTIITAMTLGNIARGTLIAAEILDPKMDQYLKLASVSEIIYSREYSRLLLGNAAAGTGVVNIIFDLLDPKTPTWITTLPILENYNGLTYPHFKNQFEKENNKCVVIGILENTGNRHRIKEMALREAQKTPDVGRLVQNLKLVKEIKCNHPIFNPGDEYLIPNGSMAIVVQSRKAKDHKC